MARIAPPPAGKHYTAATAAALEQSLAALVAAAAAVGWRPAEVFAAMRIVLQRLEDAADPES